MKKSFVFFICGCLATIFCSAQNVVTDSQTYTPQQLVEDILIDSGCISNVTVTNTVSGNFGGADLSYGYFDATGSTFPFQNGIVMSTGRLTNVDGPNTSLSDDDAANWSGDNDLEETLNETNTLNATIIEFDFTPIASQISFKYIFASEEYQEGNSNTCQFSDLFGFLIRKTSETEYTNIALVPNTDTPVKVTTVHSGIPGSCDAINEAYFESWNGSNAPINFNGQTKVLTAKADVTPNDTYHVKLVIADETNYRYDSAVFLEAGSFQLTTDLGPDRLVATGNPLCDGETYTLNAFETGNNTYRWYKDNVLQTTETSSTGSDFVVTDFGNYSVEVDLAGNCIAYGNVIIEYASNSPVLNTTLSNCDIDFDGLTTYNLYDAETIIVNGDQSLSVTDFFYSQAQAEANTNAIQNAGSYNNSVANETVYARVENLFGCVSVAEVNLTIATNMLSIPPLDVCDDDTLDGFATFNLSELSNTIMPLVPMGAQLSYYTSEADAFSETNSISGTYQNTTVNTDVIYVKVTDNMGQCYAISEITLNVKFTPELLPNETVYYCTNSFPDTIIIAGGALNNDPNNFYYKWYKDGVDINADTLSIAINETGTYTVEVTSLENCTSTREITVLASNSATIDDVVIIEGSDNNTVTVVVSGDGDYQFALNSTTTFQDSSTFTGVSSGFHTLYVSDKNGCAIVSKAIAVLGFPKFFTPNSDGYNDIWFPRGVSNQFNANIIATIFNRHGKLITQFNGFSNGWDGNFNGEPLPSDDYWFTITADNGKQYSGHFSLKR